MTDMIGLSPYYYSEGAPRGVISLLTQERTGPVDDCRDCMSWEGFVDGLQFRFAEGGTLEIRYDPAKWSETPLPPSVQAWRTDIKRLQNILLKTIKGKIPATTYLPSKS